MMKSGKVHIYRLLTAAVFAAVVLVACGEYEEPQLPLLEAGEINAAVLWQRMTEETDYTRYEYWPGHEGLRLGQSPHGAFHRVFVNQTLLEDFENSNGTAPAGSLVVKENFNLDEEMVAITVMLKVPGYDPENGDWFWARYNPDGEVVVEGNPLSCISCHAGAADNDYVIIGNLRPR